MLHTQQTRKVTVHVPEHLLVEAQKQTGSGITQTINAGLEKLAASAAYKDLLQMRGKHKVWVNIEASREGR